MRRPRVAVTIAALWLGGCAAAVKEIRHHAAQPRLERLVAEVLPHTNSPDKHYWVRVANPSKDRIGLAVLPQRHIYLAQEIVDAADDATLRALIAHGVAHHRLHHYNKREVVDFAQQAAFKVGGQFVPGLSNAHHVGGPVTEYLMGPSQESSADRQTLLYLRAIGAPDEDYARALELMADRGLSERLGLTKRNPPKLKALAATIRKRAGLPLPTAPPEAPKLPTTQLREPPSDGPLYP